MHSRQYIYHELQESNFCGKHCLNNLMQYPLFDEVQLSKIGREIDAKENQLLKPKNSFLSLFQKSQNVSNDGNFSVQVLREALERIDLKLIYFNQKKEESFDFFKENGFVCNYKSHWIALRKINGAFYDLNSLKKKPIRISEFYLSAYMDAFLKKGYTIFLVKGIFPFYGFEKKRGGRLIEAKEFEKSGTVRNGLKDNGSLNDLNLQKALIESFEGNAAKGGNKLGSKGLENFVNPFENSHQNCYKGKEIIERKTGNTLKVKIINSEGKEASKSFHPEEVLESIFEFARNSFPSIESDFSLLVVVPPLLVNSSQGNKKLKKCKFLSNGSVVFRIVVK